MDTLFSNATVVTMDPSMHVYTDGFVGVTDGRIAYVGKNPPPASEQPQNGFRISLSMFKISSPFSFPFPSFPSRCANPGSNLFQPIPGWLMAPLAAGLGSASLCADAGSLVLTQPFCQHPSPCGYPNAATAPSQTPTSAASLVSTAAVKTTRFCPKTPNKEQNEGTCPSWHPDPL